MSKQEHLMNLLNDDGIISALAIDQRGALRKMINKYQAQEASDTQIKTFKALISEELTPFASAILLDAEYGLEAGKRRAPNAGLLLSYEKTGYDTTHPGRFPDILDIWSAHRLKQENTDACKFLLYYDVDEDRAINEHKEAFIERIGSECIAEGLPFFLEIVTYDSEIKDSSSSKYARLKPHKVIDMMKIFSESRFAVDCLKVEVPVNMNYVEGFGSEVVYTQKEAMNYFKLQSKATNLPFIFLSAAVSSERFNETLSFAHASHSTFNGVLCGRATWADAVQIFVVEGEQAARKWCQTVGRKHMESLNETLKESAHPFPIKIYK